MFRKHEVARWLNERKEVLEMESCPWSDKVPAPRDVSPNCDTIALSAEVRQSSKVPSFAFAINFKIIGP
jgi:hypothetical protein